MTTARTRVGRGSWRMWGALAVLFAASAPARAFYWYDWPGSQAPKEPTLMTPPSLVPPTSPTQPPTPGGPPVPVDKPPIGPPEQTPEPATGLIGLIGLGALAARKWWKKN